MVEFTRLTTLGRRLALLRRLRVLALIAAGATAFVLGSEVWYLSGRLNGYQRAQEQEAARSDRLVGLLHAGEGAPSPQMLACANDPQQAVLAATESLSALAAETGTTIIALTSEDPDEADAGADILSAAGLEPVSAQGDEAAPQPDAPQNAAGMHPVAVLSLEIETSYPGFLSFMDGINRLPVIVGVSEMRVNASDPQGLGDASYSAKQRFAAKHELTGQFVLVVLGC